MRFVTRQVIAELIGSVVVPKSNSDGEVKCGKRVVVTKGGRGCGRIVQWAESEYWRKLSRRGLEADCQVRGVVE